MDSTTVYPHQSLPHLASLSYFAYHSPPHSPYYWSDILQPPHAPPEPDEPQLYPMHHLRFPTPPITPPKTNQHQQQYKAASATRTHSVIMKVGQGQNLQHLPATLYATTANSSDMNENSNCSTQSSVSSSTSSSTSPTTKHEEEQFLCAWLDCGRLFQSLESLAQHVTQIHAVPSPDNGLYYCRWHGCQRSERGFNARYKMLVHVRTHTKEKPHQCHMCEKSFSRAENLKIHIRSHSGEKPYKCTFEGCQKAYSNSSDRFKHTRTHTMEKPYMCKVPGCQKRYTDPSSLRKHVKTFKHSLQIMEAAATQYTQKQERNHPVQNLNKAERFEAMDEDCMSKAAAASYNMHMHLHAEQELAISNGSMPAFYAQHTPTTHWLAEDLVLKSRAYPYTALHSRNYVIDVDMDSPLDLRINRV